VPNFLGPALFYAALIASIAIRAPHTQRSRQLRVVHSRKGSRETLLLCAVVVGGLLLPLLSTITPWLAFADYPMTPVAFGLGALSVIVWLWLFYRSHADLGTNWSATLELRDEHQLITTGVYARVRHPMYTAIFCHAFAQLFLLSNWLAGPAMLVGFGLMFALRAGTEEAMMRERFGVEYADYARRTKWLIPGLW
jgi:protein-S-isoprenylcysteine O-methyltransferase Ste14